MAKKGIQARAPIELQVDVDLGRPLVPILFPSGTSAWRGQQWEKEGKEGHAENLDRGHGWEMPKWDWTALDRFAAEGIHMDFGGDSDSVRPSSTRTSRGRS